MRSCFIIGGVALAACGSGGGDGGSGGGSGGSGGAGGSSAGTLAGTVDGTAWAIHAAYSDFVTPDFVSAYLLGGDDEGSCASPATAFTAARLEIRIPPTEGTYAIGPAENRPLIVFIPPSTTLEIQAGELVVDESTASALRGTITASTADIDVDGTFVVEVCD